MGSSNHNGAQQENRGRGAGRPGQIPARGWWDILLRTKNEITQDNVSIVAAGVAFFAMLAIFPAMAAVISIYGLMASPEQVQQQVAGLSGLMPQQAIDIIAQQLRSVAQRSSNALSFGLGVGLIITLWSATKGIKSLMTALNIVYGETENRGFIKFNALAFLLTLGTILLMVVALALVVALPALLGNLGLVDAARTVASLARWPILAVVVILGLAVMYRFGPSRGSPEWNWVSWGAVIGTVLWLFGSALFSYYVSNFGSYGKTYGSVGAVVILLLWFYITAYIVLLGAELNAEMEHQTEHDTTTGEPKPMGRRRAYVADTVGKQP